MFVSRFFRLGGLFVFSAALSCAAERLNILLFVADDLGTPEMGVESMGGQLPGLTPNIDALAARGVRFFNAQLIPESASRVGE